ncbi:MAG TPA: hypothetical protein PL041_02040 [Melioribacteraceae bacterium]|nr:hypothetical protein [Melioribacteraceae bacterium]
MERYQQNTNSGVTKWVIFFYLVFCATLVFAQSKNNVNKEENKINNLITALRSDNEGLMKSAVYLAGKYKVNEVVDELCDLYKTTYNENTKYLIAISLFKIGTEKSFTAVTNLCCKDKSKKFRFIGSEIAKTYTDTTNYITKN